MCIISFGILFGFLRGKCQHILKLLALVSHAPCESSNYTAIGNILFAEPFLAGFLSADDYEHNEENFDKVVYILEDEKQQIEAALCGGTDDVEAITAMSKRLPLLIDELDEKSMRWLELSEME